MYSFASLQFHNFFSSKKFRTVVRLHRLLDVIFNRRHFHKESCFFPPSQHRLLDRLQLLLLHTVVNLAVFFN